MTNTHEEWTEEKQKEYDLYLKKFCTKFENDLKESAGKTGNAPCGFIFLFVREPKTDYIDVATNMHDDDAIFSLKESIKMIEHQKEMKKTKIVY